MHISCETKVLLPLPFMVIGIKEYLFRVYTLSKLSKNKGQDWPIPPSCFVLGWVVYEYYLHSLFENQLPTCNPKWCPNLKTMSTSDSKLQTLLVLYPKTIRAYQNLFKFNQNILVYPLLAYIFAQFRVSQDLQVNLYVFPPMVHYTSSHGRMSFLM